MSKQIGHIFASDSTIKSVKGEGVIELKELLWKYMTCLPTIVIYLSTAGNLPLSYQNYKNPSFSS
jgi:hypothetical protein